MAGIGSSIGTTTTTFGSSDTTVTDYNLVSLLPNTEYSQSLPSNCKGFWIKAKIPCTIKTSFTVGGTSTTPMTVPPGNMYSEYQFFANSTIYFQTSIGSVIVELRAFS